LRIIGTLILFYPLAVFQSPEKAAFEALMADPGALRFHYNEYRILIAVRRDAFDKQAMAGGFALGPQFPAGAAPERGEAGFKSLLKSFLIHVAHHQDAIRDMVLHYRRNQAILLTEIQICAHKNENPPELQRVLTFDPFANASKN